MYIHPPPSLHPSSSSLDFLYLLRLMLSTIATLECHKVFFLGTAWLQMGPFSGNMDESPVNPPSILLHSFTYIASAFMQYVLYTCVYLSVNVYVCVCVWICTCLYLCMDVYMCVRGSWMSTLAVVLQEAMDLF